MAAKVITGQGLTRKDVFDFSISVVLMGATAWNPLSWGILAAYSILDSMGAFDWLKKLITMDDEHYILPPTKPKDN